MNNFDPKNTKELQKKILDKFETSFAYENIFTKRRNEILTAFSGITLFIPWYLTPFRKTVTNIALCAFKKGMEENNKNDTVTIKRPNEYKPNE